MSCRRAPSFRPPSSPIRSDLPGQITAQVTEAVYDSPTRKFLLIPQGAKLIGQYDSSVAFGQSRIVLVWTRLIMPDGTSMVLERENLCSRLRRLRLSVDCLMLSVAAAWRRLRYWDAAIAQRRSRN